MQYPCDDLADGSLPVPTRFQRVRVWLRKALFIVALTGAAYSRLNAAPHPNANTLNAHPHQAVISRTIISRTIR